MANKSPINHEQIEEEKGKRHNHRNNNNSGQVVVILVISNFLVLEERNRVNHPPYLSNSIYGFLFTRYISHESMYLLFLLYEERKIGEGGERKEKPKMVRGSRVVEISKTLSEILVCPLTKQPLRFCQKSNSLMSDAIGVSFPMVDGIPCLVPKDGKIIDSEGASDTDGGVDSTDSQKDRQGGSL